MPKRRNSKKNAIADYIAKKIDDGIKGEVRRQIESAFKSPRTHFAPALDQISGNWRTWYPPQRALSDRESRETLRGYGFSDKWIDQRQNALARGVDWYPDLTRFTPYSRETHDAQYTMQFHPNAAHDDADPKYRTTYKSAAWKNYEETQKNPGSYAANFYEKGPSQYNYGRRRNLSRRAANLAAVRLSKGRYHY